MRKSSKRRQTKETDVAIDLNLDGVGNYNVETTIPFLNHMLELLAKHALLDLKLSAKGDRQIDDHHTVEDIGLVLGGVLEEALGDHHGINRYGWAILPMDEALCQVAIDLSGRPYFVYDVPVRRKKVGEFDLNLIPEFFRAFSTEGRLNLHIKLLYGTEPHHVCESVFKGVARALRMACALDPRVHGAPSSKGVI